MISVGGWWLLSHYYGGGGRVVREFVTCTVMNSFTRLLVREGPLVDVARNDHLGPGAKLSGGRAEQTQLCGEMWPGALTTFLVVSE